ncbi:MAG: CinA family protein [Deltaproteobacteria bacterium]|jgi:nicotinamide-nucleotide amidase|nr:CinA family protein [Deltaproteobacteria bacterium]
MKGLLAQQPRPAWLVFSPVKDLWDRAALVARALEEKGLTLAIAESFTGGWISAALTSIPGVSNYFMAGLVTYSNQSKMEVLGLSQETLLEHGAVSAQCAQEMALGALRAGQSNLGLATTGVAGPGGGSPQKPVGLVYLGLSNGPILIHKKLILEGHRLEITLRAALQALDFLYENLSFLADP